MIYFCCDELRRQAVEKFSTLNGIDFLEVMDTPMQPPAERQRVLQLHFLKAANLASLSASNFQIEGGERIRDIQLAGPPQVDASNPRLLILKVTAAGDFSTYTLRIVKSSKDPNPPAFLDPLLAAVDFSFKVCCPSDFDCQSSAACPPLAKIEPPINYLAKDYASFRRAMLDRIAALAPDWQERHAADLGVTLVELLAYVGDYLSYQQDAVATEAYLGTARRRISVRRHARLVDYRMHEGCNARVWIQVQVKINADNVSLTPALPVSPFRTQFLTRVPGQEIQIAPNSEAYAAALRTGPKVFELLQEATLFHAHNEMQFYTWGGQRCCLPRGATRATLLGAFPNLKVGDVLVFEEMLGPRTGDPADADPAHRHALRLTLRQITQDPIGGLFPDPAKGKEIPVAVTNIQWSDDDALPFPLCLSSTTDAEHGGVYIEKVSVARGNIVAADHGISVLNEPLGAVPLPTLFHPVGDGGQCEAREPDAIPARFSPALAQKPLTQATQYDFQDSAQAAMSQNPKDAVPALSLTSNVAPLTWNVRPDLLDSADNAPDFVVEVESDLTAWLRFGDSDNGLRPEPGRTFAATYRVGNGLTGNVGAEALFHIVTNEAAVVSVRNPLAACGGREPETIAQVRQSAPYAFRTQDRAVTEADYAARAGQLPGVQKAAATFRWTGSWHTVFVTTDRLGVEQTTTSSGKTSVRAQLEPYRMAGYDLEVGDPLFIPLEMEMRVCVRPDFFASDVKEALLSLFNNRAARDGRRGLFHPDNFTFGQPVYLGPFYAAAQRVTGVHFVKIALFRRKGDLFSTLPADGKLSFSRLEIPQLQNDPDFPERGTFTLVMEGGK